MIKSWLGNTMRRQALNQSTKEVRRFVDGLKSMPDEDLGRVIAAATAVRLNLETHAILPAGLFWDDTLLPADILTRYQVHLNKLARDFAKMNLPLDAAGTRLWSYTLRCLNIPDLLPLGREMWAEMRHGYPYVEEALARGEEERGEAFAKTVWAEWKRVPLGFETGEETEP